MSIMIYHHQTHAIAILSGFSVPFVPIKAVDCVHEKSAVNGAPADILRMIASANAPRD